MASPVVLDMDRLLAPISDDQPSGPEMRGDPDLSTTFFTVKDARERARSAEARLFQARFAADEESTAEEVDRPDWGVVCQQATDILADKSKDLWIAAWLIEALARLHGFAGLRDGFRVTRELCERYWDGIHPLPEDETVEWTVSQLAGLNGEDGDGALIPAIDDIAIIPETRSYPALTSLDYKEAQNLMSSADSQRRAEQIEQGAPTLDTFDKAVNETQPDVFAKLLEDLSEARQEFDKLAAVLDERCGKDESGFALAPPTSSIANALEETHDRVKHLTRELFGTPADEENGEAGDEGAGEGGEGGMVSAVRSREEAFRSLLKVADFFRRTEPHSPVSYALEQAVRWGRMSFPELMEDLVRNDDARREMFRRAGVNSDNEGS